MFLLLNALSRFVIDFLPRSKSFSFSWLQSQSAVILELKKIKSATVSTFSQSLCHEVMGPDTMIFVFWLLSFKPAFSLSSFTFINRLFSFYLLSAIRVVSSPYMRLLILLPAILISAWASSSLAFHMIYSVYRDFPGNSVVKNVLVIQETWVWSLGQEDLLEEGITTHCSILA